MVKTYPGTETIEEEIRATRRNIDDKVERIQQRLSPGDIVDSVVDFARTNGGAVAGGVGRTLRDHPLPIAMIGAGVLWLALSSRAQSHAEEGSDDFYAHDGDTTGKTLRERAADLRESAREGAAEVRERAGRVGHKARVQAVRATRSGGHFVKEHPVLVGAAGIALGAAIAAALPRTAREDDAFGERAERAKQAAKRAAVKEGRKVQEAARSAVEKARKAATAGEMKRDDVPETEAAGVSKSSTPGATG
jgi:ElaB/YqjD/DUF883 family membrane-anchored ribosome-binding protein